ncbi:MAG: sulfate permease [Elusimicrobia bacterium]|nr:sulfate permease [Elusimicrobiota bacterium]
MTPAFLTPKIVATFKSYDRAQLVKDLIAGLIVGVVAIPLALAFGIASGVTPAEGLYAAVIGGFLISLLGGSRVQIGGPTGAFVVIIYGIVHQYGRDALTVCTIMAGVILIVMGLCRMGNLIKWIPYPVTTGFTSGIAVIIFSSQVKDLLGLRMDAVPPEFAEKWGAYLHALPSADGPTMALSAATLAVLVLLPRLTKKIPSPFAALVFATAAAALFGLPVETIGSRFGDLPRGLPAPRLPEMDFKTVAALVRPATVVALLAAIESLLSAVVADGMIGGRHRSSMELVAQGVANVVSPLFGGIPVTGAIARTATNVKSGGRTPVAGIAHAVVLVCVLLFAGPAVARIPLCSLAAILVIVSYNMSEWRTFSFLLKSPRSDVAVLLTTFGLTVLVDLTAAVEIGMVLSAFLFMRRMAEMTTVAAAVADRGDEEAGGKSNRVRLALPVGVEVYDVSGPLFFGAADKLGQVLSHIQDPPKVFILRLGAVPVLDATGQHALRDFQARCRRLGTALLLCGLQKQPLRVLRSSGILDEFDAWTEDDDLSAALKRIEKSSAMRVPE